LAALTEALSPFVHRQNVKPPVLLGLVPGASPGVRVSSVASWLDYRAGAHGRCWPSAV